MTPEMAVLAADRERTASRVQQLVDTWEDLARQHKGSAAAAVYGANARALRKLRRELLEGSHG